MGKTWYVGIDIGRLWTACGRHSELPLLPHSTRSFTKFINQNASAFWGVFNCSKDDGKSRLYGICKLKLACLIFCVTSPLCVLLLIVFGQKLFKCFNFRNIHSKIFEKFFPVTFSDLQGECEILLPLLALKKTLLIQYFSFTSFLSSERM